METYLLLIYLLFAIAFVDLVVGVSNDAVNFLNSAVGSKVAKMRTILIIASVGILIGSVFSSGMMEVARSGIFNPGFFTFEHITILFMAVMLTDVILLDLYNSFGLPTSTTVSLVFELLGAAFMTGLLVTWTSGSGPVVFEKFINVSSAITIISGIFLSVAIAFVVGAIVQYISRLVFSFSLKNSMRRYGAVFSGLAIAVIVYFLLLKGAKGNSLISPETLEWIKANTIIMMLVCFAVSVLLLQVLMSYFKVNPLKIVVLLGTFALAMAFAGNDLVNFIGVAVAGWQSYGLYAESGMAATDFYMNALSGKVPTPNLLLIAAGLIMVVTLWISAKARKVTETEVSLSRQSEGDERFSPNIVSRTLVGTAMTLGRWSGMALPNKTKDALASRFEQIKTQPIDDQNKPAFDLVRASVNLMVASILIAFATSLKLPLSTTYVSFMVAMGTSLSDRAWGRESAVYRVAGVLSVIGGWLMTAVIAFVAASVVALILFYTWPGGAFAMAGLAALALIMTYFRFRRKSREEAEAEEVLNKRLHTIDTVIASSKEDTVKHLAMLNKTVALSLRSLVGQNSDALKQSLKKLNKRKKESDKVHSKLIKFVRKMGPGHTEAGRLYLTVFDLVQKIETNSILIATMCKQHVINHHPIPSREFLDDMLEIEGRLNRLMTHVGESIDKLDFSKSDSIDREKLDFLDFLSERLDRQVELVQQDQIGNRLGKLQIRLLLEIKDMVAISARIMTLYTRYAYRPLEEEAE